VTQREAPPRIHGIEDDEDEEKTSVGAAPEPEPGRPSPLGAPPRVHYGKFNTPTAFTPNQGTPNQGTPNQGAPGQGTPGQSAASQSPPNDGRGAGPESGPKSQAVARPVSQAGPVSPQSHASSGRAAVAAPPGPSTQPSALSGAPPDRGSSGPQPLTAQPPMGLPQPLNIPAPSGMMPYASPSGAPSAQTSSVPPQPRGDVSFAGPATPLGNPAMAGTAAMVPAQTQSLGVRADQAPREGRAMGFHITRSRAYSFVLDARGQPIELGSGRFAKAYLGEERWLESKTDYRRPIVIKILQKGVSDEDHMRFQMEKELLERVQGHPNIVELMCSGENEDVSFLPPSIRDKVDTEFMILEKLEMSLEERLKGSRVRGQKEDLLACDMRERLFRVLDYMIPIASAVEYSHLVRNICHRDIKPANVLIALPDPNLRGSTLQVRLADFNVAKLHDEEINFGMTQMKTAVPGTLFFQSPEQETNIIELLVNVQQGVPEVEYFEDFYIQIAKNDSFSLFNRNEQYPVLYADRARKRLVLGRPFRELSETNVRARIQKSVGRPADIYSLGATFYYLISGAYANPKTLYDAFHKFIEYERADENNTIEAYLRHEYSVINSLRAPKAADGSPEVAPADRFFSYKQFLDGNGELIDPNVMMIIAKCMIRNKPDSYCQAHDLDTRGISDVVADLINLYSLYGFQPGARPTHLVHRTQAKKGALKGRVGSRLRMMWLQFLAMFRRRS